MFVQNGEAADLSKVHHIIIGKLVKKGEIFFSKVERRGILQ